VEIVYGTVTVMVCRFVVAEFDEACSVSGNVIEPPPPPPLCVEPAARLHAHGGCGEQQRQR